jgi:hypothetical protein
LFLGVLHIILAELIYDKLQKVNRQQLEAKIINMAEYQPLLTSALNLHILYDIGNIEVHDIHELVRINDASL